MNKKTRMLVSRDKAYKYLEPDNTGVSIFEEMEIIRSYDNITEASKERLLWLVNHSKEVRTQVSFLLSGTNLHIERVSQ